MSLEGQTLDCKSLRSVCGKTADWSEIAKDCIAFANAQGGRLLVGIEDGKKEPPEDQTIPDELIATIQRRLGELTVNTLITVEKQASKQAGSEYLIITVSRSHAPASTNDGRYYHRVGDQSKPLIGEEIQRLLNERNAQPWETLTTLNVGRNQYDPTKLKRFAENIRRSSRVKPSVKEKTDQELLDHYYLAIGTQLTNLGILCVGYPEDRARLGVAPVIQLIKYDSKGNKISKISWDDHRLTPMELLDAVWQDTPDFRESYELPEGMLRQQIPAYDYRVVRELLVNALVHRPYTQRGDIYINISFDHLQMINPGLLPLGVTPRNILHQSVRRNNELARVFHDLELMEREGSGFDLIYEVLTSQGRHLPEVQEGADRVEVSIPRRLIKPEVIDFIERVDQAFQLTQRERIALGVLVQTDGMTATALAYALELPDTATLSSWITRLIEIGIVSQAGRTKGTRYFVAPTMIRQTRFPSNTTLTRIEPYRLEALIIEDLQRHPVSSFGEIHKRIGSEISEYHVRLALQKLAGEGRVCHKGIRRWCRYWLASASI